MRLIALDVRLRVHDCLLGKRRIDASQQLSLLHMIVEVDQQFRNLPRNLRADADRGNGVERAGSGHRGLHVAFFNGHEPERRRLARLSHSIEQGGGYGDEGDRNDGDERFLVHDGSFSRFGADRQGKNDSRDGMAFVAFQLP